MINNKKVYLKTLDELVTLFFVSATNECGSCTYNSRAAFACQNKFKYGDRRRENG